MEKRIQQWIYPKDDNGVILPNSEPLAYINMDYNSDSDLQQIYKEFLDRLVDHQELMEREMRKLEWRKKFLD